MFRKRGTRHKKIVLTTTSRIEGAFRGEYDTALMYARSIEAFVREKNEAGLLNDGFSADVRVGYDGLVETTITLSPVDHKDRLRKPTGTEIETVGQILWPEQETLEKYRKAAWAMHVMDRDYDLETYSKSKVEREALGLAAIPEKLSQAELAVPSGKQDVLVIIPYGYDEADEIVKLAREAASSAKVPKGES